MQHYAVLGQPVAHSLSPLIHKGWMKDYNLAADYVAIEVPKDGFGPIMGDLVAEGYLGFNVTLPHKGHAFNWAGSLTKRAQKIGAVNTLSRQADETWRGDNTVAPGFPQALVQLTGAELAGKTITIIGAGGAARALVYSLDAAGAKINLVNRTKAKAEQLLRAYGMKDHKALGLDALKASADISDICVNTASLGYDAATLDLPDGQEKLFYDISYGKAAAQQLQLAARQNWQTADGLSMLVYQAAISFEIWFGLRPDPGAAFRRIHAKEA